MKKIYETPEAQFYTFFTEDVLAASNPIVKDMDSDKGGNKTEIGIVPLW